MFIGFLFIMFKDNVDSGAILLPVGMLNIFALQYYLKINGQHKSAKRMVSRKIVRKLLPIVLVGNPLLLLISSYMMRVEYTLLGTIGLLLWLALICCSSFFTYRYDIKE